MRDTNPPVMPVAGEIVGITRRDGSYTTGFVSRVRDGYARLIHPTRYIALADIAEVDRCPAGCLDCPPGSPSAAQR